MRILLTGASGFIGRHALSVLLAHGHEVHAVARRPGAPDERLVWDAADLLEPGAADSVVTNAQTTHLLHLAWYATPGSFWNAPENERWIDASLRLLRAFGEAGGQRAVMAGTCAEYAWGDDVLSESQTALKPATLYGSCKHATHVAADAVAAQLGVSFAWGRIFFLYGPGEQPGRLVSSVARGLLAGEAVPTTDGLQRRDFMHVRDVAKALVSLLESDVTGGVNIASGEAPTVREIVTMIARAAGGLEQVQFGALPRPASEPAVLVGDTRRLTEEVGFHPDVDLETGLQSTVEWWRAAPRQEDPSG